MFSEVCRALYVSFNGLYLRAPILMDFIPKSDVNIEGRIVPRSDAADRGAAMLLEVCNLENLS
jgi:hypothetical protein